MSELNRQQLCAAQDKGGRTELYRHFDKRGNLLYVGISLTTVKRLGEHRTGSAWFRKVATITIQHFRTRKAALEAERIAIQTENPIYNVTGRLRGYRTGQSTENPYRESWRDAADAVMADARRELAERRDAE
jgi:hypothetical protein